MAEYGEAESLMRRKQELLAQSEVNRRALAAQSQRIHSALAWIDVGIDLVRRARPALIIVAPLAGFWLARKATFRSRVWSTLAFCWRWYRRFLA
jgi:hypothetical protein